MIFPRRKRRVRYHLFDGNGHLDAPSLEGIETGLDHQGHYVGFKGVQINGAGASVPLEGDGAYAIARERVFYRQVLR
jgi:hypothetical protein